MKNVPAILIFCNIFCCSSVFEPVVHCCDHSDNIDSNSILENSLNAKEKIISELNMELHNIETTLTNEREQHVNEIKKLNAVIHEKVRCFVVRALVQILAVDI